MVSKYELPYHKNIQVFQNHINLEEQKQRKTPRNNVSTKENEALKSLVNEEVTKVTKVDKGGAVVILDVDDYINETDRLRTLLSAGKYKQILLGYIDLN